MSGAISGLDASTLWRDLNLTGDWHQGQSQSLFDSEQRHLSSNDNTYKAIVDLIERFQDAKTFGSLIEVPNSLEAPLKKLLVELTELSDSGDTMQKTAARQLMPIVQQAWVLAQRYEAVVANPPYMGSKYQTPVVKKYLKDAYKGYEKDLFSAFIIRNLAFARDHGQLGFMTPFVWMFISSYEQLRKRLIEEDVITSLIQLEYSGFDGATVPICTFTLSKGHIASYTGSYIRLSDFRGAVNQGPKTLEAIQNRECGWFYDAKPDYFNKIPGSPVAFWLPDEALSALDNTTPLGEVSSPRKGMCTRDNDFFVRTWFEISFNNIGFEYTERESARESRMKWFPYQKGGDFRQWYGNQISVVNWEDDGFQLLNMESLGWRGGSTNHNLEYIFKPAIVWSKITSHHPSFRISEAGFLYDDASGLCSVTDEAKAKSELAFLGFVRKVECANFFYVAAA